MNDENRAVPEQFFYSLLSCDCFVDYESSSNPPHEVRLFLVAL